MKVRIADAEIDFDRMVVRSGDAERKLTRQPLGILRALVDADGDIVTKDQLVEQVWGGRIITDATLSTAMKEARRATGDTGTAQRIIETVHGVGFRLAVPTERDPSPSDIRDEKPAILVLPFRSLSAAPEDAPIADGFSEEITSNLTRFRNLRVLSHLTAIHLQTSDTDQTALADTYGIDFVVEGSLRRASERLRVTVQVSDVRTGEIAVMEQFDRPCTPSEIFDIQDEIGLLTAGRVASQHGALGARIRNRRVDGRTTTWDVYTAVAQFYEFYKSYDPASHLELRTRLPALLETDANASDGWAAYALILLEEQRYHLNERPGVNATRLGLDAAKRGVACDPQSGFAQMVLALCQFHTGDLSGFRATAETALRLNPGHADILAEIGHCHAFLGEFDRAIPLLDKAIELSPVHPGWYHYAHAWRFALGDFWQAALLEIEKVPMPGFPWYHAHQVWFHAELGNAEAADTAKGHLLAVLPNFERDIPQEMVFHYFTGPLVRKAFAGWKKAGMSIIDPPEPPLRQT
ncbi:winged helix-turn-helix domain-containing protein [uncultured Tateyamaria sp.]|uniref:winged helix-turn-helix domain-containing tetratricopeptide repeat protein n=1 Tax=Tateyamaria sp. 1078 TaxID=3417464 RepID=UPI0026283993|nr:winged helix-turn-helix domain-containing protein [uncultured Tateyamaria sp.]